MINGLDQRNPDILKEDDVRNGKDKKVDESAVKAKMHQTSTEPDLDADVEVASENRKNRDDHLRLECTSLRAREYK